LLYYRYTLIFLTRGDSVLMLHRRNPPNKGLWNGVGGRLEPGETPLVGALREVCEETGYPLSTARFAGLLTWEGYAEPAGGLYIFTAAAPPGDPQAQAGDEGVLAWKPRAWVLSAPEVVENIHLFGPLVLDGAPIQDYHFIYAEGDRILSYEFRPLLSLNLE
jgi:8-oxo-dGTP diphosphatase